MKKKKKTKRCRHVFGGWHQPSDEPVPYRVCDKCGGVKFKGDRYVFGSRWK